VTLGYNTHKTIKIKEDCKTTANKPCPFINPTMRPQRFLERIRTPPVQTAEYVSTGDSVKWLVVKISQKHSQLSQVSTLCTKKLICTSVLHFRFNFKGRTIAEKKGHKLPLELDRPLKSPFENGHSGHS